MSPLEVLQLVGHSIGAAVPLWLALQLLSRQRKLTDLERVLFALALSIGVWQTSNLILTLHSLLGLRVHGWSTLLRLTDTAAVVSITLAYSFLLHVHLHLWANAANRSLTRSERVRVYLSYIPIFFLFVALPAVWRGAYAPMLTKLSFFVLPFAIWVAYVLALIAVTELLIANKTSNRSERRIMRTLALSFVAIGLVILAALALGVGEGRAAGLYLKTIANLGSLLPTMLLAYYIYRYRYLQLIIEESLIVATFAAVVLTVYLYGIRTVGDWMTERYGIRAGVVEALLILVLALGAAPLRRWLADRFHKLFEREARLYREIVSRIGSQAGRFKQLPDLLRFVEVKTAENLGLQRVKIAISGSAAGNTGFSLPSFANGEPGLKNLIEIARENGAASIEDDPVLLEHGFAVAYPLRREDRVAGLLMIDGSPVNLGRDARAVLEILAGQLAIAVEDSLLFEENVRLERQLAESERLAELGQMAATVAHEIKNPLSAIKSIAQVMKEDTSLSAEYARDLSLIVGETDRLSQSVTQLLTFARNSNRPEQANSLQDLISSVLVLFRASADEQKVQLQSEVESTARISGEAVGALRDSFSNLLLNALQATSAGGAVRISGRTEGENLLLIVEDDGPGVPESLSKRIWEPFFTTKQRGTGLGLAIVRKRMQEVGGFARLLPREVGKGAKFELRMPVGRGPSETFS